MKDKGKIVSYSSNKRKTQLRRLEQGKQRNQSIDLNSGEERRQQKHGNRERDLKEIHVLFHSSGLTSNQWRKLKNLWFLGGTVSHPSYRKTRKKKGFSVQLPYNAGPTCVLYLPEETSDKLELLPLPLGTPRTNKICFCYMGNTDLHQQITWILKRIRILLKLVLFLTAEGY